MLTDEECREVDLWVHRVDHLRWRKGRGPVPEGEMVAECWMPYLAPNWAAAVAEAGEPGSQWCPLIDPTLWKRGEP